MLLELKQQKMRYLVLHNVIDKNGVFVEPHYYNNGDKIRDDELREIRAEALPLEGLVLDFSWHEDLRQIAERVCQWYEAGTGALVLSGDIGCGKSHIAKSVHYWAGGRERQPLDEGPDNVFISEPDFIAKILDHYGNILNSGFSEFIKSKLLIFDDLGVVKEKETKGRYHEIWWRLLDARLDERLPILITTNLKPEQIETVIGKRASDRLIELLGSKPNLVNMWDIPSYRRRFW